MPDKQYVAVPLLDNNFDYQKGQKKEEEKRKEQLYQTQVELDKNKTITSRLWDNQQESQQMKEYKSLFKKSGGILKGQFGTALLPPSISNIPKYLFELVAKHSNPFIMNQIVYTPYNSEINQKPEDETTDEGVMDYVRELLRSDYTPHPAVTSEQKDETKDDSVETPTTTTSETDVTTPVQKQEDATDDIFGKFGNSIDHFEGFRLNAYRDAHGWSIGKGHFLGEDPSYSNMTITQEQADKYFEEDSKNIRKTLNNLLNKNPEKAKSIDDVRYNILFDLGYNGGTGLLTSLFNKWDGSEENMESLLNRYATTSKAKDYARKIQEEKGLRKRANARVAAWKKTVNNKNQNWRTTMVVKHGGKVRCYQRQYDLSWNPFINK